MEVKNLKNLWLMCCRNEIPCDKQHGDVRTYINEGFVIGNYMIMIRPAKSEIDQWPGGNKYRLTFGNKIVGHQEIGFIDSEANYQSINNQEWKYLYERYDSSNSDLSDVINELVENKNTLKWK